MAALACLTFLSLDRAVVFAQNSNPLDQLWPHLNGIYAQSNLLNTTDASEAEAMLKSAGERAATQYGADSPEVLQTTLELCRLYKMQCRFGELGVQLGKAASIYSKLPAAGKSFFCSQLIDFTRDLVQQNRSRESRLLTSALVDSLSSDQNSSLGQETIARFANLALTLKSRKDYAGAEPIYRAVISAYERGQPPNALALSDARTHLAELLKETDRLSAAKEFALLAYEAQERLGLAAVDKSTNTLILLIGLDLSSGDVEQAKKLTGKLDTALSRPMNANANANMIVHPVLDLCTQFAQAGDFSSVKTLFTRSFSFANQYSASQYEMCLKEISKYMVAANNKAGAEGLYIEHEQWVSRSGSVADINYRASAIRMLAVFYAETEDFKKLELTLNRLSDFDAAHQTAHLANLQSTMESVNNSGVREKYYQLLANAKRSGVDGYKQAAHFRSKLADLYLADGRHDEAKKQWYQTTQMMEDCLPADCKDLGKEVRLLLDAFIAEKHYRDAQQLAGNMTAYGFSQNVLVSAGNGYRTLASYQDGLGHTEKAAQLAARGMQIAEKYAGRQSYNYFDALNQYAQLLRKGGKIQVAAEKDREATQLQQELQKLGIRRNG
ncbi:MAG: hypothetical protein JST01_01725 [Cyanobacteria bacterium SZAS TMP-1]|nr:hypothetical protein [Cyanobacteria bacterium SZAS TMP-1]